ncbi:hypothetical protein [Dactylosporangium sp. NPDC005555]|uniref:hypothetical protein n=1 Tax=Dactylosporangium sp. NPDC005555 TaxID=3154889 RepID=UPI0033A1288D
MTRALSGADLDRYDFERRRRSFRRTEPRVNRQEGFGVGPAKRIHRRLGGGVAVMLTALRDRELGT